MSTAALNRYRRRAYADAAAALTPDERVVFDALESANGSAALLDRVRPANTAPADVERVDGQTLALMSRQLEHVMSGTYEEPLPGLLAAEGGLMDFNTEVPDGASTFAYYVYAGHSLARFSSSYSDKTAPTTTISAARVVGNVECMENSYGYTFREMREAAFGDVPLDAMAARYARRGHDELLNSALLWGREEIGIPGMLNHPNITISQAPADGTASSRRWSAKSVDLILRDCALLIDTPGELSFGMREVTSVKFAREEWRLVSSLRMGAGDGAMTVLNFLRQIYPGVDFGMMLECAASQSDGNLATNCAIAYVRNRELLSGVNPMPFTQYPPEINGLRVDVWCESSTGGVMLKEPLTVHRMDGIGQS